MVSVIALTNARIYSAITVMHIDMCALLLGPTWVDSTGLLIPLAACGYLNSLQNTAGSLLLGLGRAKRALAWNSTLLVFYPSALVVASKFGVVGLASSLLVTAVVLLAPAWRWLVQPFTGGSSRGTWLRRWCRRRLPQEVVSPTKLPHRRSPMFSSELGWRLRLPRWAMESPWQFYIQPQGTSCA